MRAGGGGAGVAGRHVDGGHPGPSRHSPATAPGNRHGGLAGKLFRNPARRGYGLALTKALGVLQDRDAATRLNPTVVAILTSWGAHPAPLRPGRFKERLFSTTERKKWPDQSALS